MKGKASKQSFYLPSISFHWFANSLGKRLWEY